MSNTKSALARSYPRKRFRFCVRCNLAFIKKALHSQRTRPRLSISSLRQPSLRVKSSSLSQEYQTLSTRLQTSSPPSAKTLYGEGFLGRMQEVQRMQYYCGSLNNASNVDELRSSSRARVTSFTTFTNDIRADKWESFDTMIKSAAFDLSNMAVER